MGEKPVPTQRAETHGLEEKVKMTRLRATIAKDLRKHKTTLPY